MNVWKLLTFPISRLKVDDSVLINFRRELQMELRGRGIIITEHEMEPLLDRLVQEAYYRAGKAEADGIPLNGPMEQELDVIVRNIEQIWRGKVEADPPVAALLVQYGLLKK